MGFAKLGKGVEVQKQKHRIVKQHDARESRNPELVVERQGQGEK